jgi:hypothetical protein
MKRTRQLIFTYALAGCVSIAAEKHSFSLREEVLFERSYDLRDTIITHDQLDRAISERVVLVDVSQAVAPFRLDNGEYFKMMFTAPEGATVLETLYTVMKQEPRRIVDLGFRIRVFTRDRVFQFRFRSIPEEFAKLKLAPGDVVIVSMR